VLCTVQQARDAGATGEDPEVTGWIAAATVRITRYTSQLFEPTTVAVVADVAPDGLVLLPRRVRTITSVTPLWDGPDDAPALPTSAYRVTSSATLGQVDSLQIAYGGYDDLIAGAESWAGGWAGLFESHWTQQVTVSGEFGYDAPPMEVSLGCALLAAEMQAKATPSDADAAVDDALDVDDEGNNVRITEDESSQADAVSPVSSTGSTAVDALLAPYINGTARPALWGV
jgi:hypothetical protein